MSGLKQRRSLPPRRRQKTDRSSRSFSSRSFTIELVCSIAQWKILDCLDRTFRANMSSRRFAKRRQTLRQNSFRIGNGDAHSIDVEHQLEHHFSPSASERQTRTILAREPDRKVPVRTKLPSQILQAARTETSETENHLSSLVVLAFELLAVEARLHADLRQAVVLPIHRSLWGSLQRFQRKVDKVRRERRALVGCHFLRGSNRA